jgi:hypothetical protein
MGPCARDWSTEGGGKATDGAGGSGYANRPPGFLPLTWHFRMPARCRNLPRHRTRIRAGVLNAESVGDAPFGGGGLAVDAVSVDLEQDGDAVPVGKVLGTSRINPF